MVPKRRLRRPIEDIFIHGLNLLRVVHYGN